MTVLRRRCIATLVEVDGVPVGQDRSVALRYDSDDPYTVGLVFADNNVWEFGRDLLAAVVDGEPHGAGDVCVWLRDTRVLVHLGVPPDRWAVLDMARADVLCFVMDSYALVAPGLESEHLDIDLELTALLRQGYTGRRRAPDDAPLPDPWRGPWPDGGGGRG